MRLQHKATIDDFKNAQDYGIYIGQKIPNNGSLVFDRGDKSTFAKAIQEIKNNKKVSHWIWYVIPSPVDAKASLTAQFFSVNQKKVLEYLSDKILLMFKPRTWPNKRFQPTAFNSGIRAP